MMTQTDHLVAAYLAQVERAAGRLPAGRREELLGDLREHIEISRAESGATTEAEIRTILERLGDPESIVAAADTQTDMPRVPPAQMPPVPAAPFTPGPAAPAGPANLRPLWIVLGVLAVVAVFAFCAGALLLTRSHGEPASDYAPRPDMTVPAERIPTADGPATTTPSPAG